MEQQSHGYGQFSHSRVKTNASASFFSLQVHTAFVHFPIEQAERALSQGMCLQVAH